MDDIETFLAKLKETAPDDDHDEAMAELLKLLMEEELK